MFKPYRIGSAILFFTAFFSILVSYSQENTSWGLNVGVTQNSYRGNDYSDIVEFQIGYLAGVGNRINIGPNLNLDFDLNYELKLVKLEPSFQIGTRDFNFEYLNRYHFINLPMVFDVTFDRKKRWFFELGGYINFLLGESLEIETIIPKFRDVDYGLVTGVGKVFSFTDNMDFILGIRYELGLVNSAIDQGNIPATIDVRSSSIKFLLTWVFAK